ncbi:MAG: hypothetical protein PHS41_09150, partial [Victivallaceae bacterium]|nr:hypothetical protein [Victivallaceae bacterium]
KGDDVVGAKTYVYLQCPSNAAMAATSRTHYAINLRIAYSTHGASWAHNTKWTKVTRILKPSELMTFLEHNKPHTDLFGVITYGGARDSFRFSHDDRMNVPFLDGHVERRGKEITAADNETSPEGKAFFYGK